MGPFLVGCCAPEPAKAGSGRVLMTELNTLGREQNTLAGPFQSSGHWVSAAADKQFNNF